MNVANGNKPNSGSQSNVTGLHLQTKDLQGGGSYDLRNRLTKEQADILATETARKKGKKDKKKKDKKVNKLEISAPVQGSFRVDKHFGSESTETTQTGPKLDVRLYPLHFS